LQFVASCHGRHTAHQCTYSHSQTCEFNNNRKRET
jgi:hypothetical protein